MNYEDIYQYICAMGGQTTTVGAFLPIAQAQGWRTQCGQSYVTPRGLGRAITATYNYVARVYGDAEADKIATTFVDPVTGEWVWKKYH